MHTIHEGNYTVSIGNSKAKKINKHQAQLMGWMRLICTQIIHLCIDIRQRNTVQHF